MMAKARSAVIVGCSCATFALLVAAVSLLGGQDRDTAALVSASPPPLGSAAALDLPKALSATSSFYQEGDGFFVVVNRTAAQPADYARRVATVDAQGFFVLPKETQRVVIEIGTNDEPEMTPITVLDPAVTLIAFEPRPDAFAAMTEKFPRKKQLIAIPAAVSDMGAGSFVKMNVGGHRGCSSLLPMSSALQAYAARQKKNARKKSQVTQLRTVEFCAMLDSVVEIAALPVSAITSRIPPHIPVHLLMTDAQGYDTNVISTLPIATAAKIPYLVTECQDLGQGDRKLLLVEGAPTCAEQRSCIEKWFPQRLEFCWFNAPKVRELNCLYAHPGVNVTGSAFADSLRPKPRGLKVPVAAGYQSIMYDVRPGFRCPAKSDIAVEG